MKKSMLAVLLFAAPVFAQSPAPDQAALTLTAVGCGPSEVKFDVKTDEHRHPTALPESGKAMVYIIGDFVMGSTPTTRVGIDGTWVGANHGNSYFFVPVDPGNHHLCVNWQSPFKSVSRIGSAANFTAEQGGTYYFRAIRDEKGGGMGLEPVDPAKGQFLLATFAFSTSHPKK